MTKLTKEHLIKMERCSPLLPAPGPEVVEELMGHIWAIESELKALREPMKCELCGHPVADSDKGIVDKGCLKSLQNELSRVRSDLAEAKRGSEPGRRRNMLSLIYVPWWSNWRIRLFIKWFSLKAGIQCSGKYRWKYALVYCQKTACHDGVCVDGDGKEFTKEPQP